MTAVIHTIIFLAYAVAAVAAALLTPADVVGAPLVLGVAVFALCGLVHEVIARRASERRLIKNILLLKRAYDLTKEELYQAKSGSFSGSPGPGSAASPISGSNRELGTQIATPSAGALRTDPFTRDAMPEPAPPAPSFLAPSFLTDNLSSEQRPTSALSGFEKAGPLGSEKSDADHNDRVPQLASKAQIKADAQGLQGAQRVSDEMAVMHGLLEKLYANAPAASSPSSSAVASTPGSPTVGTRSAASALRVVSTAAPEPDTEKPMLDTVREALKHDRVDLYLQPIVSLPQRKRRFFECYSRIRDEDGDIITPDAYLSVARQAGLLTTIDNMLLLKCIQLLRRIQNKDGGVTFFCNISPHTLADREFLKDFIDYMEKNNELASNLVLEFAQRDFESKLPAIQPELVRLGALGYRFSIDRVRDISFDARSFAENNVHYVKVDAALLLDRLASGSGADIRVLKQQLDSADVDLIIERIETEQMLIELLDYNIDYGQGYLFGEPRISKSPAA